MKDAHQGLVSNMCCARRKTMHGPPSSRFLFSASVVDKLWGGESAAAYGGPCKGTRWRATFRNTALQPWWQARLARSCLLCLVPSLSFQELTLDVRERLGVARSRPLPISGCRWDGSWQLADFQLRLCSFQGCQGSAAKTPLPAQAC